MRTKIENLTTMESFIFNINNKLMWNGEDAVDGTYFYQITVRSQIIGQNLEVKADGFVHLVSGK